MKETDNDLLEQAKHEAEHFNKYYAEADLKQSSQNYLVPEKIINQVLNPDPRPISSFDYAFSLLGKLDGKNLLDYGAGDGWNTVCFAKAKARVWAIDISEKGIDLINKKAKAHGVSDLVIAEVRNCYKTNFKSNKFDIIYGGGVLHHLDLDEVGKEISRIIHPDGVAVFYEPIRDSKVTDTIKAIVLRLLKRKPSEETEDESPLTSKKLSLLNRYFKVVNYRQFIILSSANKLIKSESLKWFLMWADCILMKLIPGFKKLGRAVVIELRNPVKK